MVETPRIQAKKRLCSVAMRRYRFGTHSKTDLNKKGEMLGKEPILDTIRQNSSSTATQIIDAIFFTLDKFSSGMKIEDDITLVVIKMQN
jgi:hypothetical protein